MENNNTTERTPLGLPPLRMVLGEVPNPEPNHPIRRFGTDKPEEAKMALEKLIGKVKSQ